MFPSAKLFFLIDRADDSIFMFFSIIPCYKENVWSTFCGSDNIYTLIFSNILLLPTKLSLVAVNLNISQLKTTSIRKVVSTLSLERCQLMNGKWLVCIWLLPSKKLNRRGKGGQQSEKTESVIEVIEAKTAAKVGVHTVMTTNVHLVVLQRKGLKKVMSIFRIILMCYHKVWIARVKTRLCSGLVSFQDIWIGLTWLPSSKTFLLRHLFLWTGCFKLLCKRPSDYKKINFFPVWL